MNIVETATDVIVLCWVMLITAYTMMLNKKVDAIRDERSKQIGKIFDELRELESNCGDMGGNLTGLLRDMADIEESLADSDRRTVKAIKQHKEALRELYEYAQKAGGIRSDMLQKIADLERWVHQHEARHIEQEEEQWKD